jgi:DNA-binding transcriptional ArsR family regulator
MAYSSGHERPRSVPRHERPAGCVSELRGAPRAGGDVREHPVYRLKAELFRTLGHPARVRLLELLGEGERTIGELQDALELDSSGASQHLSALRRLGLLESRKVGTSVHCRIKDRRTLRLLVLAREILTANLEETRELLGELDAEGTRGRARPPLGGA